MFSSVPSSAWDRTHGSSASTRLTKRSFGTCGPKRSLGPRNAAEGVPYNVLLQQLPHLRVLPEGLQAAVDEHADVAFLPAGALGDLGVTESLHPQVQRLALAGRQVFDQQQQQSVQLGVFCRRGRIDLAAELLRA